MSPFLEAALAYAELGLAVFPLRPRDKVPLIAKKDGGKGVHDATTDPGQIAAWWQMEPHANVGLAAGQHFFVLDLDYKDDPAEDGETTLSALIERHGPLPRTVAQRTGGGGMQLFFAPAEGIRNSVKRLPGLDTRSWGGYVAAPPSIHPSGRVYRWARGRAPGEEPFAQAPAWLLEALMPPPAMPAPPAKPVKMDDEGWCADRRLLAYGRAALEGACREVARCPPGAQCDTLEHRSWGIGRLVGAGIIPRHVAMAFLVAAGCQMTSQPGRRPWTRDEIQHRVRHSLEDGMAEPWTPEKRRKGAA